MYLWRRLLIGVPALMLVNATVFWLASLARPAYFARSPLLGVNEAPLPWPDAYLAYLAGAVRGDFGPLPSGAGGSLAAVLLEACVASFGLLGLVLLVSITLGLLIGARAIRVEPPRTAFWLTVVASAGAAIPAFFLGSLLISMLLLSLIYGPPGPPLLPIGGYGWGAHLILPLLVLTIAPTAQIAQITASLMAGELSRQYVTATRSVGHSWASVLNRYALRNVLAPTIMAISAQFRLLLGELVIVEYLFNWPGLGRLVALTLVLLRNTDALVTAFFLNPAALASVLTIFAALCLLADLIAVALAHRADPRVT